MLPFVPARRNRVLEIGCGEARFIQQLAGVEDAWGIEPSPAAEIAKDKLNRVFHSTFDEAEKFLPPHYFDLVICNDVIEHLPDYSSFLYRIGRYIAPGGMLIGSIPNVRFYDVMMRYLFEKDWCYADSGVLDRTHLWFFTKKSLRATLKYHGFDVVRLEGINTGTLPSLSALLYLPVAYALVILTLGYFADIRHLQFAFQAIPTQQ